MPTLKTDMAYMFDEPVEYKGLKIHPAKMRDYYIFITFASCLFIERTAHTDPKMAIKAISMSYLDYLFYTSNGENNNITLMYGLIHFVLSGDSEKPVLITHMKNKNEKIELVINGEIYTSQDFDAIRAIIAEQNSLELPDERIQKNVRDELEKARRYKQKLSNYEIAGLEEQMMALSLYTGWELDYIYKMTVRKFFMAVKRANHMIMSNIYISSSMSGFSSFKDKRVLRGWLADINNEDKYGDVKVDPDALQRKVNFDDAKIKGG